MGGEHDLAVMLESLRAEQRGGGFVFLIGDWPDLLPLAHAVVQEAEGQTLVVSVDDARAAGAAFDDVWAWLTLNVHSALGAVGLTAAVSAALADVGIPCNMIAGAYHDHLLVPVDRAAEAMRAIGALRGAG